MKINITVFNTEQNKYISDTVLDLAGIPNVGDKVVYNDKNKQGQVYIVDEVMYGDDQCVTVFAHWVKSLTEYNERLGLIPPTNL